MDMHEVQPGRRIELKTTDYVDSLSEGVRVELIDGIVYDMGTPSDFHQELSGELSRTIGNYIHDNNGECKVRQAPYGVYLTPNKLNFVEPDISVICDKDKIDHKGCHGAPDWVIEIISPSSVFMDCVTKLFKYRDSGVREYWIVNPEGREVNVQNFEHNESRVYTFKDEIPVGIYPGFAIRIDDIIAE